MRLSSGQILDVKNRILVQVWLLKVSLAPDRTIGTRLVEGIVI